MLFFRIWLGGFVRIPVAQVREIAIGADFEQTAHHGY
jgi:hypothetical protein